MTHINTHICKTLSEKMIILSGCVTSGSLFSVFLTPASRPVDRYSALNESAAQKAEHVDLLRCAGGQSLDVTFQRQQRQQQTERAQSPVSHESSLRRYKQPLQSEKNAELRAVCLVTTPASH